MIDNAASGIEEGRREEGRGGQDRRGGAGQGRGEQGLFLPLLPKSLSLSLSFSLPPLPPSLSFISPFCSCPDCLLYPDPIFRLTWPLHIPTGSPPLHRCHYTDSPLPLRLYTITITPLLFHRSHYTVVVTSTPLPLPRCDHTLFTIILFPFYRFNYTDSPLPLLLYRFTVTTSIIPLPLHRYYSTVTISPSYRCHHH